MQYLPILVKAQFKYRLPILAQVRENIEAGALGGPVINYTYSVKKLANYADRIFQGESPTALPIYFDRTRFTINLTTAAQLGVVIPNDVASQSEILGITDAPQVASKKDVSPIAGQFTIAIPLDSYGRFYRKVIELLGEQGYTEGKNLQVLYFNNNQPAPAADLILTSGSVISQVINNNPKHNIVAISIYHEDLKKLIEGRKVFMVYRSSTTRMAQTIARIFPNARIGLLYHESTFFKKSLNLPVIVDEFNSMGLETIKRSYNKTTELKEIIRELKEIQASAVLLLPPSLKQPADLTEVVKLQQQLKIPIISHEVTEVRAGLALGIRVDTDELYSELVNICDQLMQNKAHSVPKITYIKSTHMVNLKAIHQLGLKIPQSIIANSDIIY
jgi:ABC-type uncharacterized transport system substrate-binding protein